MCSDDPERLFAFAWQNPTFLAQKGGSAWVSGKFRAALFAKDLLGGPCEFSDAVSGLVVFFRGGSWTHSEPREEETQRAPCSTPSTSLGQESRASPGEGASLARVAGAQGLKIPITCVIGDLPSLDWDHDGTLGDWRTWRDLHKSALAWRRFFAGLRNSRGPKRDVLAPFKRLVPNDIPLRACPLRVEFLYIGCEGLLQES